MSPRDHLALVMDPSDNAGDESAQPALTLEDQLALSITDAMTKRLNNAVRRIERLEACPEIAAMLARMDSRRTY